jgi:rhodanese-related sulfurtransferase
MDQASGFLKIVAEAKSRVRQTSVREVKARLDAGQRFHLVDVREADEWSLGHLPGASHLSKGVIERDIESAVPDKDAPIVCYCGGGFRSVLVCENLQRMGYTNCVSLDGGWRGWNALGLPVVTPPAPPETP